MKQISPIFILIGLQSGYLSVWNSNTNEHTFTKPHIGAVTALEVCQINGQNYILSGDSNGQIKVFNADFKQVLQAQVANEAIKPLNIAISSFIVIQPPITAEPVIAASDVSGQITLYNPLTNVARTFGAHLDLGEHPHGIRQLIQVYDGAARLVSIGEAPILRIWSGVVA